MFSRTTQGLFVRYHRRSMGLSPGKRWAGNFGAYGCFFKQRSCVEEIKPGRTIIAADRDHMNEVHSLRIRHDQLLGTRELSPSKRRTRGINNDASARRRDELTKSFQASMQFEIRNLLHQQADLVTQYGQASVNKALGEPQSDAEKDATTSIVRRRVSAPPVQRPVKRFVATQRQFIPHRFDRVKRFRH